MHPCIHATNKAVGTQAAVLKKLSRYLLWQCICSLGPVYCAKVCKTVDGGGSAEALIDRMYMGFQETLRWHENLTSAEQVSMCATACSTKCLSILLETCMFVQSASEYLQRIRIAITLQ